MKGRCLLALAALTTPLAAQDPVGFAALDSVATVRAASGDSGGLAAAERLWGLAASAAEGEGRPREAAHARYYAAIAAYRQGAWSRFERRAADARPGLLAAGDTAAAARLDNVRGLAHEADGDSTSAAADYRRAMALAAGRAPGELGAACWNLGLLLLAQGAPDSAAAFLGAAADARLSIADTTGAAEALERQAAALAQADDAPRAVAALRRATGLSPQPLYFYNMAGYARRVGLQDSARVWLARAWAGTDPDADSTLRAGILVQQGSLLVAAGKADSALPLLRQAAALLSRLGRPDGVYRVELELTSAYGRVGLPDSSVAATRRALAAAREIGDPATLVNALHEAGANLGLVGLADTAITYFREALRLARQIRRLDLSHQSLHLLVGNFLIAADKAAGIRLLRLELAEQQRAGSPREVMLLALWLGRLELQDSGAAALKSYQLADSLATALADSAHLAWARAGIGVELAAERRFAEAVQFLTPLRQWPAGAEPDFLLSGLRALAIALTELGQPDSAHAVLHQGLGLARDTRRPEEERDMLARLGAGWARVGRPAAAVAYFDSAYAVATRQLAGLPLDLQRLNALASIDNDAAAATLAWLQRAPDVGAEAAALEALAATDRSRNLASFAFLRDRGDSTARPLDAAGIRAAVRRRGVPALLYQYTTDTLVVWLVAPSGAVTLARQAVPVDSLIGLVVGGLRRACCGDGSVATRAGIAAVRAPTGAVRPDALERLAAALLPAEIRRRLPARGELVVVPGSTLSLVPFAALPVDSSGAGLGERLALRYSSSLSLLGVLERRPAAVSPTRPRPQLATALVVGNPVMPVVKSEQGEQVLPPLAGAEREARWVARRLGTRPLLGALASEHAVRTRLRTAPLLHFATHGYAFSSAAEARAPFLALAGGGEVDGLLTAREVVEDGNLLLRADLVVLSACQTALGQPLGGEGLTGLQRAFLLKGARAVLASLWSVSDDATALLMQRFYEHWLDDRDRPSLAEALRRAQADVRADPRFPEPRYWAAFQLVGAG